MKTALGQLSPLAGGVALHREARLALFAQSEVEQLRGHTAGTALGYMQERWPEAREQELRNILGSFGLPGSVATQPLQTLSGGQAVRVALAAAFNSRPHLLLLDEPSNHLDLQVCLFFFFYLVVGAAGKACGFAA